MEQMSLFDVMDISEKQESKLKVVNAKFIAAEKKTWQELFDGYDELYAITYSSGLSFTSSLLKRFSYAEIIYGCEDILPNGVGMTLALQTSLIEKLTKSKYVKELSERVSEGTLSLYVSRNTISHEKIYCLKSNDGKTRVIVGSANMSQRAFEGYQHENITYFDDPEAYEWYKDRFEKFRELCSDNVNEKVLVRMQDDSDYLRENPEEIPVIQTVQRKKMVFLEPANEEDDAEIEIVTNAREFESELKPMLPKTSKEKGRIVLNMDSVQKIRTAVKDNQEIKKVKRMTLPKLHLDYESDQLDFNGKVYDLYPTKDEIARDIDCMGFFFDSLSDFHGDYHQAKWDYYRFMNWFLASPFLPFLRYVADRNNYDVTTLPVFGILYGDSNGGKSTFVQLLIKLMTNKKIPVNPNEDFTYTRVRDLRRGIEGVPINFDDLDKTQFRNHIDKIVKDDEWGITERFMNYPAVVISTNKLPSLEPPIMKRVVGIRIDVRIGKEEGLNNSRKLKESLKNAGTAFFSEYVRRMMQKVKDMANRMKEGTEEFYADIFAVSSSTILEIYRETVGEVPPYMAALSFSDYYGDKVIGKTAIKKIKEAWTTDRKNFTINRKKNILTYRFPDNSAYEINYLKDELPAQLNARKTSNSLVMDLDEAEKFFEIKFHSRFFAG